MTLIDADALTAEIQSMSITISGEDVFSLTAKASVVDHIRFQPTIDAVPVVHGEWVEFWDEARGKRYGCSMCASSLSVPDSFCPHCGAKMDEARPNG